jgi:hypothetical protein
MKLHSEMSIGWVIVYACFLASLSGKTSTESNVQGDHISISPKDSISVKPIQDLKQSSKLSESTHLIYNQN